MTKSEKEILKRELKRLSVLCNEYCCVRDCPIFFLDEKHSIDDCPICNLNILLKKVEEQE